MHGGKGETAQLQFGDPAEWKDFASRNREFVTRLGNLLYVLQLAFATLTVREPVDKILFHLARLCAEDFSEILLFCSNGFGIGAEKLLRSMYERAVTATYLHQHPEEAENFLDYHKVSAHRLLNVASTTLGADTFSPELMKQIEDEYQRVKPKFMITACEKCATKRLNHTWTKIDLVTMAMNSGGLEKLLVPAYYMGLREGHSTVGAIFSRLDADAAQAGDGLVFDGGSQRKRADVALLTAHKIILIVLDLHKEHFQLETLEEPLQACTRDLFAIWERPAS
jgi:Family of unknown function (DUF5677)